MLSALWVAPAGQLGERVPQPLHRVLHHRGVAQVTKSQMSRSAWSERGTGREPDIRVVDKVKGELAGIGDALDAEESVECAGRRR